MRTISNEALCASRNAKSSTPLRDYKKLNITVEVNASIGADIILEVGQATQQISVNADAIQVDTTSTQLAAQVSRRVQYPGHY